ncbi:hypothetical protein V5O48_000762 [Marasmius crinis-equi]|uniref:F-box domain-containing protein n=1 Tax=Marasmius crinis-equi TaxID=585013 RepID=A0ABR3G0H4_9AGAR
MSSPYLPFDIWKCVAEYLPDEQLKQLRTVNRALCLIAREIEYRKVGITVWDKNTKERLRALGDPDMGLGQHVRAVEITPWVIPCTVKLCTKRAKLWNGINTLLDSNYPSRRASDHLKRKLAKHTRLVTSTVQNLPHLQEYSVQWSPGSSYHPELFSAFLGPILHNTELGQNLTKLSVKAPTEKLSSLAPLHLPKLERLELDLHTGAMLAGEINDHFDALIVFVNNTMRTLRALSVSSTPDSTHLDLNRFFHRLGTFPNLTSFTLNIPYDGAHVSSPSFLFTSPGSEGDRDLSLTPMEHFIKKHADHIQELRLKCSRASPPTARPNPHAKFWIQRILARIAGGDLSVGVDSSAGSSINVDSAANEEYPRLHTLEVPLRPLKSSLQPLRKCVSVLAGQLKSLTLTDRALMEDELKMIFNMSPSVSFNNFTSLHSLTNSSELSLSSACCRKPSLIAPDLSIATLSLRVQALSPSLLEVIAQAVPGLTKLELEIGGFARDYTPPLLAHSAMQHPHYKAWCLRKLKIKTPSLSRVQRWSQSQSPEKVLRTCIPGLEVETEIVRLV